MTKRLVMCCASLFASLAHAQLINETMESGALASPWELTQKAGITCQPSAAAAHRGLAGLRLVDAENTVDAAPGTFWAYPLSLLNPVLYTRFWVRRVSQTPGGMAMWSVFERKGNAGNQGTALAWGFDYQGQLDVTDQGLLENGSIGYHQEETGVRLDGGWQLLETAMSGLGGLATVRYAVDGKVVAERVGVPAYADRYSALEVGEVYANDTGFQCTVDFDDLRVDALPLASRLELRIEDGVREASCTPLTVRLLPTFGALDAGVTDAVPAPYDVALAFTGLGPVFTDAACRNQTTTPTLSTGLAQASFSFVAPKPGTVNATVEHRDQPAGDFLPGEATFGVVAATGSPDKSYYALGCQSAAGPHSAPMWVLAAVVWLAKRSRSTVRKS